MSCPCYSVIVPVYNAEKTLARCVQSILQQAPQDLELILVNDGSQDGSGPLCDELARQDARIRVVHQPNRGASAARNAGLELARGHYIQFVDADDWVLPGLYQAAGQLLTPQVDLLIFGVQNIPPVPEPKLPDALYASLGELRSDFKRYLVDTGQFACPYNKFYSRQLIGTLRFDVSLPINEDFMFNLQVLKHCGAVRMIPQEYYAYDQSNLNSLSRSLRTDFLQVEQATRSTFEEFCLHYGLSPQQFEGLLSARMGQTALAQMSHLMERRGPLSLRQYCRIIRQLLAEPRYRQALAHKFAADSNRLLALPYRFCIKLRFALPMALWCWLRCSTTHSL